MYAVVKTGGKQYRVSPGDSVEVEKLPYEVGEQIELDQVLLVANGSGTKIGQPLVEGAKVKATVTRQGDRVQVPCQQALPPETGASAALHPVAH
jgi:large subunit ribosomal protein L21